MTEIPIIGESAEVKLIISFKKLDSGAGSINISFEPDFDIAETPEQMAAINIANSIVDNHGLKAPEEKADVN